MLNHTGPLGTECTEPYQHETGTVRHFKMVWERFILYSSEPSRTNLILISYHTKSSCIMLTTQFGLVWDSLWLRFSNSSNRYIVGLIRNEQYVIKSVHTPHIKPYQFDAEMLPILSTVNLGLNIVYVERNGATSANQSYCAFSTQGKTQY